MNKTISILGAAFLGSFIFSAQADEPTLLTDAQMDGVTAGSVHEAAQIQEYRAKFKLSLKHET